MQLRSSNKYPPHGSKSRSARQCFARLYKKYCSSTLLTIEPRSIAPSLGKDVAVSISDTMVDDKLNDCRNRKSISAS
jgi:hypothetical protein